MIIVLNAPPGAGKDTIGRLLNECIGGLLQSYKQPMWEMARASLGDSLYRQFKMDYDSRLTKEQPLSYLGGFSPRQFFIHISEKWCKPVFGEDYFGQRMLLSISENPVGLHVITDGGFPRELDPLLRHGHRVMVVRMHREGFDFSNDSRAYLREDQFTELPKAYQPLFLDVLLEEGNPFSAVERIRSAIS